MRFLIAAATVLIYSVAALLPAAAVALAVWCLPDEAQAVALLVTVLQMLMLLALRLTGRRPARPRPSEIARRRLGLTDAPPSR